MRILGHKLYPWCVARCMGLPAVSDLEVVVAVARAHVDLLMNSAGHISVASSAHLTIRATPGVTSKRWSATRIFVTRELRALFDPRQRSSRPGGAYLGASVESLKIHHASTGLGRSASCPFAYS